MKICVAGMGLIGGSICLALKRAGYCVEGWNRSEKALSYALEHNIIDKKAVDFGCYDVVFVALPPKAAVQFILDAPFKSGAVVADICGVKRYLESSVLSAKKDIRYIGTHPMAGKEVSGVENACADLFDRASMVITRNGYSDRAALDIIKGLVKDMGFKLILECSAEVHDRKIAYTSQLAHVVSNCYVKDGEIEGCLGFTGGSFQDMTRIAGVDERVWASLYLENADNLLKKTGNIISALTDFYSELKTAKEKGDEAALAAFLSEGAEIYRAGKEENFTGGEVKVTRLKKD